MKLTKTPDRLVKNFVKVAQKCKELGQEFDRGNGWNDLVSLGCTPKHWIHAFVDESPKLQKFFKMVSILRSFCPTAPPSLVRKITAPAYGKEAKEISTHKCSTDPKRKSFQFTYTQRKKCALPRKSSSI